MTRFCLCKTYASIGWQSCNPFKRLCWDNSNKKFDAYVFSSPNFESEKCKGINTPPNKEKFEEMAKQLIVIFLYYIFDTFKMNVFWLNTSHNISYALESNKSDEVHEQCT